METACINRPEKLLERRSWFPLNDSDLAFREGSLLGSFDLLRDGLLGLLRGPADGFAFQVNLYHQNLLPFCL